LAHQIHEEEFLLVVLECSFILLLFIYIFE